MQNIKHSQEERKRKPNCRGELMPSAFHKTAFVVSQEQNIDKERKKRERNAKRKEKRLAVEETWGSTFAKTKSK
jgi:hypothetical protein